MRASVISGRRGMGPRAWLGALQGDPPEARPMGEINTTPLVDVLLVLLVMLIITVPISTHAVKLDLPVGSPPPAQVDPVVNTLTVDRKGATRWNGEAVDQEGLRMLLAASAAMTNEPELHVAPEADAPYAAVDSVLADAKRAQVHRLGFVGNQTFAKAF